MRFRFVRLVLLPQGTDRIPVSRPHPVIGFAPEKVARAEKRLQSERATQRQEVSREAVAGGHLLALSAAN